MSRTYLIVFNEDSEHWVELSDGSVADAIVVAKEEFRRTSADLVTDVSAHLMREGQ